MIKKTNEIQYICCTINSDICVLLMSISCSMYMAFFPTI